MTNAKVYQMVHDNKKAVEHSFNLNDTLRLITSYWRNFGCFRVFFVLFGTVLFAFFGGGGYVFGFELTSFFFDIPQLFFMVR